MQQDPAYSSAAAVGFAPSDADLRDVLERALADTETPHLREISRRPLEYRTSFPLEILDLTMEDGGELRLVFKQLDWSVLGAGVRLAKPQFLHDPQRESAVYASVLPEGPVGPPRYYGSVIEPHANRHWLFVEWVEGRELYQVGERALWEAVARWLGEMHIALAADLGRHVERGRLLDYDAAHYRCWIERARRFARAPARPSSLAQSVDRLSQRYDEVVEGLLALPRTVVHGEFYASNVLVAGEAQTPRVSPVDWELAAAAPGIVDLAALISGSGWAEEDRAAIVAAYRSAVGPDAFSSRQLDLARLHIAVQWLGWAPPSWDPPVGQRQDWLGEALALAETLGL
jgi:thiamine kinase-like enzyme